MQFASVDSFIRTAVELEEILKTSEMLNQTQFYSRVQGPVVGAAIQTIQSIKIIHRYTVIIALSSVIIMEFHTGLHIPCGILYCVIAAQYVYAFYYFVLRIFAKAFFLTSANRHSRNL